MSKSTDPNDAGKLNAAGDNVLPYHGPAPELRGPVLTYATPGAGAAVVVARCAYVGEAEMIGAVLDGHGIPYSVLSGNFNSMNYGMLTPVEVQVPEERAEEAVRLIAHHQGFMDDEMEPLEDGPAMATPVDADGNPVQLVVAAAFETPRGMRDAATILASARVPFYLTPLAPRGDRPRGRGARFAVRVAEDDLVRAECALHPSSEDDDAEDEEEHELRCPKCGAYRVFKYGAGCLATLASLVGYRPQAERHPVCECLACGHKGDAAEFRV